jgi:hypothetical protein
MRGAVSDQTAYCHIVHLKIRASSLVRQLTGLEGNILTFLFVYRSMSVLLKTFLRLLWSSRIECRSNALVEFNAEYHSRSRTNSVSEVTGFYSWQDRCSCWSPRPIGCKGYPGLSFLAYTRMRKQEAALQRVLGYLHPFSLYFFKM